MNDSQWQADRAAALASMQLLLDGLESMPLATRRLGYNMLAIALEAHQHIVRELIIYEQGREG